EFAQFDRFNCCKNAPFTVLFPMNKPQSKTIRVESISKTFSGDQPAVNAVSFTISDGKTLALIGTSGSGKTTILKILNRLLRPDSGRVIIRGTDISGTDATGLRRQIGYIIQGAALFPHWTISQNVGLVPRLLGWRKKRIESRVTELLQLVGLPDDFRSRYPAELSGGQQQRVGIARALAADPPIILLDEPFSALDPITRRQLQDEFLNLRRQLDKTMVLVTHDLEEAFLLADEILVLDRGEVQQIGSAADLRDNPANDFVKQFVESQLR
ncbi:MAG: ATP-binding cassette domain-containing protein, partial [Calditrichaeota bacterium]|nr:ATP-binding cassette domain-containing protein [Calditrichota bacterium]